MKKTLLALLCGAVFLGSCNKSTDLTCAREEKTAPASEVFALESYIQSMGISAVGDPRGFFYVISRQGSGIQPTTCSNVKVSYTLRLSNGTQAEAANGVSFNLSSLIPGWKAGLPLIGEGGSIVLYLPPSLGYGDQASGNVPANSILIFHIDLIEVN